MVKKFKKWVQMRQNPRFMLTLKRIDKNPFLTNFKEGWKVVAEKGSPDPA